VTADSTARTGEDTSSAHPWLDPERSAEERAGLLVDSLTVEEKIALVSAPLAIPGPGQSPPPGAIGSAAATPGVPRLGLAMIQESDASLGISNPNNVRPDDTSTALPSTILLASTFDPDLARAGGVVVGAESAAMGFAIQLAGGVNLIREPRGGRNFEYISEDPLLSGAVAGAAIDGIQSQHVVSTIKHFAVNPQETGRVIMSSDISEAALRESDLLAFQIAIERGHPGSVMTAYNRVNGEQASENAFLLTEVLKGDWAYPGFVMSDWGGTHSSAKAALAGLDRQSGSQLDTDHFFGKPLAEAVRDGAVPMSRLDDMVYRLVHALIVAGVVDRRGTVELDLDSHREVARAAAEQGLVLLSNDGTLPLTRPATVAVIGGHADVGVLSGGGSAQVAPAGSIREKGSSIGDFFDIPRTYHPAAPLGALKAALPDASVVFADGTDPEQAARHASECEVAIVFVEQWTAEGHDVPDLSLPGDQDALVSAVAAANRRTVVVVESGAQVLMPWRSEVAAVVEAWYPGACGGEAIAAVLTGTVCPSGRLPVTFPAGEDQLPRPRLHDPDSTASSPGLPRVGAFSEDYDIEGADVGYRWYDRTGQTPVFPFGFGLSYTSFSYSDLTVDSAGADAGPAVSAALTVTNTGERSGIDTPQVYVRPPAGGQQGTARLAGFARVPLDPGESRRVEVNLEPRVFASYDVNLPGWRWAAGDYALMVGTDARTPVLAATFAVGEAKAAP
jgi:beta-glucosidase